MNSKTNLFCFFSATFLSRSDFKRYDFDAYNQSINKPSLIALIFACTLLNNKSAASSILFGMMVGIFLGVLEQIIFDDWLNPEQGVCPKWFYPNP